MVLRVPLASLALAVIQARLGRKDPLALRALLVLQDYMGRPALMGLPVLKALRAPPVLKAPPGLLDPGELRAPPGLLVRPTGIRWCGVRTVLVPPPPPDIYILDMNPSLHPLSISMP